MSWGMLKMSWSVLESWSVSLFMREGDPQGVGIADLVPRRDEGPAGQNVSQDLPRCHWPSLNWNPRALTLMMLQ